MFEQESYDRATEPTVISQPGELFYNYEIKSWFSAQTLYKVLAISAVLNLAFLAVVSQTNVLTARGCDSPWVGRVCQVVDMAYVGAVLFGTEREYADVAYERTELSPDDEITYIIETPDNIPLDYPQGYFQIANPVQYAMLQQQAANGLPGATGTGFPGINSPIYTPLPNNNADILKKRANPPAANPNAYTDDSDSSPLFKVQDTPSTKVGTFASRKGRGGKVGRPSDSNTNGAKPEDTTVANTNPTTPLIPPVNPAEPVDEAKADQFGVFINKRPLKDRAKDTVAQVTAKDLKLDKSFKVVIEGTLGLGKDGKTTVLKNPKLVPVDPKIPNDPEMVKLAQDWILAVGDAGWYAYLDRLDDKTKIKSGKVVITIEQNETDFVANIRSEKASENSAKSIASGLGLLLQAAAAAAKGDEQTFLKAANAPTSEGKILILNFSFPKPVVQELIQRKLAEAKEEKTEPNSTAVNSAKSTTATK
ncbi:MAG: hypothetical protein HOP17_07680 [Acidobacteria bacterium]|nr:hypothetical protein [Acidobacteriota bacterium]